MDFRKIKSPGITRIDRIVAEFELWTDASLPFAKFRVKIIENADQNYVAIANVAIRNPKTGFPEGTSGMGPTVESALEDFLKYFHREIEANKPGHPLTDDDFEWLAHEDF